MVEFIMYFFFIYVILWLCMFCCGVGFLGLIVLLFLVLFVERVGLLDVYCRLLIYVCLFVIGF